MRKHGFKVNFCKGNFWVKGVYSFKIFIVIIKLNAFQKACINFYFYQSCPEVRFTFNIERRSATSNLYIQSCSLSFFLYFFVSMATPMAYGKSPNHKEESKMKGTKELQKSQKILNKIAIVNPHLSVITLNANGLNHPTKRHRVAEWIKKILKPRPNSVDYKRFTSALRAHTDGKREMEKDIPCKWKQTNKQKQG